jgi:anti-sigma-K factor RskA
MTTDDDNPELRYAEYVLGVLDADERAAVERETAESDAAAVAVAIWRRRLLPLSAEVPAREPPPYVWERIRARLGQERPGRLPQAEERVGWWESLRFWRWSSLATAALLLVCLALLLVPRRPAPPAVPYMAAALEQANGQVRWTAFMDLEQARMVVVPAPAATFPAGRAPQLWLIPRGRQPISVGVISARGPSTLPLGSALLAQLGPTAVLAVSVEPPGGSPTGQPTGPVVATGAIGAAPSAGGPASAVGSARTTASVRPRSARDTAV